LLTDEHIERRLVILSKEEVLLTIVVVSRNLERYIGRCLQSIVEAAREIGDSEILLVDSASTDATVEIARGYPVRILQLSNNAPLSPSAGRYAGSVYARGRYVHFQDGDSLVYKDWFEKALPYLESHRDVAGVVGVITQEEYDNRVAKKWIEDNRVQEPGLVDDFESFILVKREVLEEVGSFNPWLKAREEGELASRILEAGYKIHRLPYRVSHHLGYERESLWSEMRRKIVSSHALGMILRLHLKDKGIRKRYLSGSRDLILLATLYPLLFLSIVIAWLLGTLKPLYASTVLLLLGYLWIITGKEDVARGISSALSLTVRWPFLLAGFLRQPKNPSEYPVEARWLGEMGS